MMKNVAGYDVSRLMAGAPGHAQGDSPRSASKVLPVAPAEATLRFECSQAEALRRLQAWCGQPLPLNASCWVHDAGADTCTCACAVPAPRSRPPAAAWAASAMDASAAADWAACRDQRLPWFAAGAPAPGWTCGACPCPPPRRLDLPADLMPPLIGWHGALRWVWAPPANALAPAPWVAMRGSSPSDAAAAKALQACLIPLRRAPRSTSACARRVDPAGIFNPAHGRHGLTCGAFATFTGQHRTSGQQPAPGPAAGVQRRRGQCGRLSGGQLYTSHGRASSMLADHLVLGNMALVLGRVGRWLAFVSGAGPPSGPLGTPRQTAQHLRCRCCCSRPMLCWRLA